MIKGALFVMMGGYLGREYVDFYHYKLLNIILANFKDMHYPVMLRNVLKSINNLKITRKINLLDCNFGLGGHSNAIVK